MAVQHNMPGNAVPHVTVNTGWLLGLSCVLGLLFFLHFVSRSIDAGHIIRSVADELKGLIEQLPAMDETNDGTVFDVHRPTDNFKARYHILRAQLPTPDGAPR